MSRYPRRPQGWAVSGHRSAGPFTTAVSFVRADGRRVEWSSRAHRKHASSLSRVRPGRDRAVWAPHRASWWIAVLFVGGSVCFVVAPLPGFLQAVGPQTVGAVFFGGSVLFTAAALVQWLETVNADPGPGAPPATRLRVVTWEPHRIDWWISGVQLLGTLFFNASTFSALSTAIDSPAYNQQVWRPDALGSVCFLVSGYLAYVEVAGGLLARPLRTLEGGIVAVNLLGCVAFGASAAASYVLPSTGGELGPNISLVGTSLGALAFLIGALLLLPEGAAEQVGAQASPSR